MTQIHQHRLANGLHLVAEPIAGMQSLSMSLLAPAGAAAEPEERQGVGAVLAEMICRGAGDLDAKAHSDALDQLGVQRGTSVESTHLRIGASMLGQSAGQALPLLLDMARRPQLPENALEPSRDLALQGLDALEDEPQQKVFIELRRQHQPPPLNRSVLGRRADLEKLTLAEVKRYWQRAFVPGGTILGFAGQFDWPELRDLVERQLGDWQGSLGEPVLTAAAPRGYRHEAQPTAQVHIGLAYDTVPESDLRAVLQRAAVAVLSGGMGARLFTEVREKRGLCYSVFAAYTSDRTQAAVLSYAGTTVPRAQETLDVLTGELRRLSAGIEEGEYGRAIVGMKSRLVMQGESTGARAYAIAVDQYLLGRPRTLAERAAQVDGVTLEKLNQFVREHPPGAMTVVTIGPEALRVEGK